MFSLVSLISNIEELVVVKLLLKNGGNMITLEITKGPIHLNEKKNAFQVRSII